MRLSLPGTAVVAAVTVALLAPTGASAARPKAGEFHKRGAAKGLYMETTKHTVRTLWLFCVNERYAGHPWRPELRSARYEVRQPLRSRRDGRLSFRGTAARFGPEGQPLGRWRVRLTGRFTSPTRVRIKRTLPGCDTRTVSAVRTGDL